MLSNSDNLLLAQNTPDTYTLHGFVGEAESREPLIGANILIVGTTSGTVTDFDGHFELKVKGNEVELLVTYTGYASETRKLSLPYAEKLIFNLEEDVILSGGCIAIPRIKPLAAPAPAYYPHPALSLRGRAPGLLVAQAGNDPWAVPEVRARGIHTLLQKADPLWVIGGLPGANPLLYDGLRLGATKVLHRPVDLLPYGLQAGSGVVEVEEETPDWIKGWQHQYRSQLTYGNPQRLPEVATTEAYRQRWPERPDLGYGTDWLAAVTRNSWSHDHAWRTSYVAKGWNIKGDLSYRNAQGVGRNSEWQQVGGRLRLAREFYRDRLQVAVQAIGNRRWGERDYYQTFFQAAKYNPTAPIGFSERPQGDVFLEGMYDISQESLRNYFEVVSSVDLFNPVAMQTASSLLETRTNQALQADVEWKFTKSSKLIFLAATQANDQIAGEENTHYAYFRGNATQLYTGAAGRWAWVRRQQLLQTKFQHEWRLSSGTFTAETGYRFQRFRFGNENSRGQGLASDDFTYQNFASRLLPESEFFQHESAETHRLIDFLAQANYQYKYLSWRTAFLYQGSTRLGPGHRWQPLVATDMELNVGQLLDVNQLDELYLQAGYGLVGGLPQNEESYQGQYNSSQELPRINNENVQAEQRRLLDLGFLWKGYSLNFDLHYQHSQTRNLIASQIQVSDPTEREAVGINLGQAKLVNGSLSGRLSYRRFMNGINWRTEFSGMYLRTKLRSTGKAGPEDFFANEDYRVVESARLRNQNGGLGIAVLQLDAPYGQLLGRQYDATATQAAGQWVTAELFAGDALTAGSAYGVVGNALPTTVWSWRNRLDGRGWVFDFQFRAELGHELAHLRRGELEYTVPQEIIYPASRNYLLTEYKLEGVEGYPVFTDYYVERADYLSLDFVSLSYEFARKHKTCCTLSLTVQNLGLWTNYSGVDPSPRFVDTGLDWNGSMPILGAAGQLAPGIDRRAFYPRATLWTVGVDFKW